MEEEAVTTTTSSPPSEVPVVELRDPYEPDYLASLPIKPKAAGSSDIDAQDRANPWTEPAKIDRKYAARLRQTTPLPNDYHEAELSLANPIAYTPTHPSRIPKPSLFKRASARARTKPPLAASAIPVARPIAHSSVTQQSNNQVDSTNNQIPASTIPKPPILRPPISTHAQINQTSQAFVSSVGHILQNVSRPQFAGAPNFTRFSNGSPQVQVVNHFEPQYPPSLNTTTPNQAPPAHSASNVARTLPTIALRAVSSTMAGQTSQSGPQRFIAFPTPSQPVTTAYMDYVNQLSKLTAVDYNALVQRLSSFAASDNSQMNLPDITLGQNQPNEYLQAHGQQFFQSHQEQMQHNVQQYARQQFQYHQQQYQQQPQPQPHQQPHHQAPHAPRHQNHANVPKPNVPTADEMVLQDMHVDAADDDEYQEVETYADYEPAKLKLGKPHPDPVVETSSLSTVEPPDVTYKLKLPAKVMDGALLSSLQLESVIYACQQHDQLMPDRKTRRGFLIGDGAGVGKGRTIAGIIYENYLCGRKKSIWLSVSTDLKLDAERDLRDIGAKIPVFLLNKFQYGRRINEDHGVIFTTYSGLVSKSQTIRGNYGSRLAQLVAWAGTSFDGVIVFDECHKAKNITLGGTKTSKKLSKTAEYVLDIQTKLPNARIVYASATGASETRHLGYMTRLGIWGTGTPYPSFAMFCEAIEKRGVGAMELVAVELKMRGAYIARQLSFKTTSFSIERANLTKEFMALYDQCVDMWALALRHFQEAESYFSKKELRSMWPSFWAAHQKFFKYMCISAKVPIVIDIVRKSLEEGKCAVIGLQSTGEAKTLEALEDGDVNEFVSTAKATFESLIENHFPAPTRGRRRRRASASTDSSIHPYFALASSDKSSSTTSSTTVVDEQWINNDSCKFVIQDGVALPRVAANAGRTSKRISKPSDKKQRALLDLIEAKKKAAAEKSARTLRHKRRLAMRQTDKSRVKKLDDSDETEVSSPQSDSDHLLSSSDTLNSGDSDSDYSDVETVPESEGSDDELTVVATKSARHVRRPLIEEDSDDDVQIMAIKTPVKSTGNFAAGPIMIDSDEVGRPEAEDEVDGIEDMDPMVVHAARLTQMQQELFAKIDELGPRLPNNTLDDLIDRLGGPTMVAEMTGRKGRMVKDEDGQISYRQRNEIDASEALNIEEKKRFMDGDKCIAIISEAASSGISLQADRRVANTRRRVHITIELPWSADRAIQQFGRTHRSNQLSGPEYVFIISDLAGETRFASIVAKRLESLGALTHGDRRATTESRDLSQFNLTGKYCRLALENINQLLEYGTQFAEIRPDYKDGNFIQDARQAYVDTGLGRKRNDIFSSEPGSLVINIFLNRILGMKVNIQNAIFDLFTKITDRLITRKKVAREYDLGILELNSASGKTRVEPPENFLIRTNSGFVRCTLRNVRYERGISWEEARAKLADSSEGDTRDGFYIAVNPMTKSKSVILAIREAIDQFRVYKPNVGRQPKLEMYSQVISKFDKVSEGSAEKIWRFIYNATDTHCIHMCHFNNCKRVEAKMKCDIGIRHRLYCILSGGILTIWPYLEAKVPEATRKIDIIRLRLDDNTRVIGPNIPQDYLDKVRQALKDGEYTGIDFNLKKR